jgi:tRNA pseudouridine55 synthase
MVADISLDRVVAIFKNAGITSATLCNQIKRTIIKKYSLKKLKVGHGGTLDKQASGIMIIGLGKGCKKMGDYLKGNKKYIATGIFGIETDTLDIDGDITCEKEFSHITEESYEKILQTFIGEIDQIPPKYSALKIKGSRASDLARKGIDVVLQSRKQTIFDIKNINFTKTDSQIEFSFEVEVDGGTYVRSLIRDIGRALNSCATMTSLIRIKNGVFIIDDCINIANI